MNRLVLEGILWILRSEAGRTCRRNICILRPVGGGCGIGRSKIWLKVWRAFLSELNERQQLQWSESFLDGSFAPAKKGAAESEKPKRGKGTKWMVVVDGRGLPLKNYLHFASPAEVRLAETTLAAIRVGRYHPGRPRQKLVRVTADKAYEAIHCESGWRNVESN